MRGGKWEKRLATIGILYGEISVVSNTTGTVIAGAGTPVQVTIFDTNGESRGMTPDHTNDHIVINQDGNYFVAVSATVNSVGGGGSRYEMTVRNKGTAIGALHCDRNMAGGGATSGVISMSGHVTLKGSDMIEVWIENETGGEDYLIEDITLSIIQVGV